MRVVKLKCPNCGANLEMDDSLEQGFCQYCGGKIIIKKDKPVQNITNNITNNTIKDSNVTIMSNSARDFVIKAGTLVKYEGIDDVVTIPSNVKRIGDNAFEDLNVIKVSIPDNVTKIGNEAFRGCKSLKEINIPNGINEIGHSVFYECESLKEINIPNGVTEIGLYSFYFCSSLEKINIPNTVEKIENEAFQGCKSLKEINIPNTVTEIGEEAFAKCSSLEKINIPNSLKIIKRGTFCECSSLKEINIPNSVTAIEMDSFRYCSSLEKIDIPSSVTVIQNWAFGECESLKEINIQSNETEVFQFAFDDYKSNKSGCYVATAIYGSYNCPEVWTLRRFRDYKLAKKWYGRAFIYIYYAISPTIVKLFGKTKWFKKMWKRKLDKMVKKLQTEGFEDTPYKDKEWKK